MDALQIHVWLLLGLCTFLAHGEFQIGVGRADTTGPVEGVIFMGYVNPTQEGKGLHMRQFSRAFIIEDKEKNLAVFVSSDVGMIGQAVKCQVVHMLQEKFGDRFTDENVILSGTHTHSGPGGFLKESLFDLSCLGFSKSTFNAICDGIYTAIVRANDNMKPGKIFLNNGTLSGININRSPTSYLANPEAERNLYGANTDEEMVQLKFMDSNDNVMGMINWFPIHPTSMNNTNRLVSSDNMGYAAILAEKFYDGDALPGKSKVVFAFASTNLGDVSPNTKGAKCIDTGLDCEPETSTCNGSPTKCIAFGPGNNMSESTNIIAEKLSQKAIELSKTKASEVEITGNVKIAHIYVDMPKTKVMYTFENGTTREVRGCSPAMGYSAAAGTTDGPGAKFFHQGMLETITLVEIIRNLVAKPTSEDVACHHPKPILLPTGRMHWPYEWQLHIVPIQELIIGPVFIAAVPGEFTTMSGRRLKRAIEETATQNGVAARKVIVAGLCNSYTDYVTTPEEYQKQRYEAASTIFGPHTLSIYVNYYKQITKAMLNNKTLSSSAKPKDLSSKVFSLRLPVIFDWFLYIGKCVNQSALTLVIGETAYAVFNAGHPRNDVMHEETFLTVEKKEGGDWKIIANDASWETKFTWEKTKGQVTIDWDTTGAIPGNYRICHFGYYKVLFKIPYKSESAEFTLKEN